LVAQSRSFVATIRHPHDASRDPPPSSQSRRPGAAALLTAPASNEKPFQSRGRNGPMLKWGL
jgi:hypothetical protein